MSQRDVEEMVKLRAAMELFDQRQLVAAITKMLIVYRETFAQLHLRIGDAAVIKPEILETKVWEQKRDVIKPFAVGRVKDIDFTEEDGFVVTFCPDHPREGDAHIYYTGIPIALVARSNY